MSAALVNNLGKQDPIKLALGAVIVIAAVYYLTRKTVTDVAQGAGGLVSGNNAITKSARTDAYQNAGIVGTLGAAADNASGGLLSKTGEALGSWTYDAVHWLTSLGDKR